MDKHYFRSEIEVVNTAFEVIAKKAIDGPVIIFAEWEEDKIAERLSVFYNGTVRFIASALTKTQ